MTLNLRYLLLIVAFIAYTVAANSGIVIPDIAVDLVSVTAIGSAGVTVASELKNLSLIKGK